MTVEMKGFEPTTPCLQGRCSPNWATPPYYFRWYVANGNPQLTRFKKQVNLFLKLACPYNALGIFNLYKVNYFFKNRQPPILPHRYQCSIFGRMSLNRRVRDGNGCYPQTYRHRKGYEKIRTFLEPKTLNLALLNTNNKKNKHSNLTS